MTAIRWFETFYAAHVAAFWGVVGVISLIFGSPINRLGDTVINLSKIPPQRLNRWWRKARLESAEVAMERFTRLTKDDRYLLINAFRALTVLVASAATFTITFSGFVLVGLSATMRGHSSKNIEMANSLIFVLLLVVEYALFGFALTDSRFVWRAGSSPGKYLAELGERVEKLRDRLD